MTFSEIRMTIKRVERVRREGRAMEDKWEALFKRATGEEIPSKETEVAQDNQQQVVCDQKKKKRKRTDTTTGEKREKKEKVIGGLEEWLELDEQERIKTCPGYKEAQSALERLHSAESSTSAPLIKVHNFLPSYIAKECFSLVDKEAHKWQVATQETDEGVARYGAGSTRHRYDVGSGGGSSLSKKCVSTLIQTIQSLLPGTVSAFQASRYSKGHFIEPHDDVAQKEFDGQLHQRVIAVILYLTPEWKPEFGGSFDDLTTGVSHTPIFNSLVAFKVPRLHQVSPVLVDKLRYTIFGWFYHPCADETKGMSKSQKRNRRKKKKGKKK